VLDKAEYSAFDFTLNSSIAYLKHINWTRLESTARLSRSSPMC